MNRVFENASTDTVKSIINCQKVGQKKENTRFLLWISELKLDHIYSKFPSFDFIYYDFLPLRKKTCLWIFKFTLKSNNEWSGLKKLVNLTQLYQLFPGTNMKLQIFIFTFHKSTDADTVINYAQRKAKISELLLILFFNKSSVYLNLLLLYHKGRSDFHATCLPERKG